MKQLARTVAWAIIAATAVGSSACGGGSSSAGSPTTSESATSTVTATVTSPAPPSASTTTTSTPTTEGPRACADGSIHVSVGKQGAGLGNNFTVLLFRNVSAQACELRGYPGVTPYVRSERGTPAKRTTTGYFGNAKVRAVLLRPDHFASAMVNGSDTPTGHKRSCPTYTSLRVTPPNLYRSVTLETKIPACARLSVEPVTSGKQGSSTR